MRRLLIWRLCLLVDFLYFHELTALCSCGNHSFWGRKKQKMPSVIMKMMLRIMDMKTTDMNTMDMRVEIQILGHHILICPIRHSILKMYLQTKKRFGCFYLDILNALEQNFSGCLHKPLILAQENPDAHANLEDLCRSHLVRTNFPASSH